MIAMHVRVPVTCYRDAKRVINTRDASLKRPDHCCYRRRADGEGYFTSVGPMKDNSYLSQLPLFFSVGHRQENNYSHAVRPIETCL